MYFVGIITSDKSRKYINSIVKNQIKSEKFRIIFITEKNAENMKNIRFDTIVINKEVKWLDIIQNNLKNINLILNSDLQIDFNRLKGNNLRIINYGFNSKATITLSSNTDDGVQICIQRNIMNKKENIEQQEISLMKNQSSDIYDIMLLITILLMYDKNKIKFLKL